MTDKHEDGQNLVKSLDIEAKRIAEAAGLDTVTIIATYLDLDEDEMHATGSHGSLYARFGAAKCWVKRLEHLLTKEDEE